MSPVVAVGLNAPSLRDCRRDREENHNEWTLDFVAEEQERDTKRERNCRQDCDIAREEALLGDHHLRITRLGDTLLLPSVPENRSTHVRRLLDVFLIGGIRDRQSRTPSCGFV